MSLSLGQYFCKVIKKNLRGFLQRILQEIMKNNNTLNIRRLVDETIIPSTQHIILKIVGFLISKYVF